MTVDAHNVLDDIWKVMSEPEFAEHDTDEDIELLSETAD